MKNKTNKGITLIALVITIIVMLILVAVTISMAVNGGLFDYAGKAVDETQGAINAEQQLANLEANMTVDDLIDKYTDSSSEGVDLSLVNVGDYISNYSVQYTNVADQNGNLPEDKFANKWRVLSKVTDDDGSITGIKLLSAGVPVCYWHYNSASASESRLTKNFLKIEITGSFNTFDDVGFTDVAGGTLEETFSNELTEKVQALTKSELDEAVVKLGGDTTSEGSSLVDPVYLDMFSVPCKADESSEYAMTWLATGDGTQKLWYINSTGSVSRMNTGIYGIRVVVTLKPTVKFSAVPESEKINDTTTWKISI